MKKILILIPLFFASHVFSEDLIGENSFEYTRKMYAKVEEISKLTPDEFELKINQIRADIDRYVEHKKGVCQGDFSTVILGSTNTSNTEFKLSKAEQELCYRELKALQITYINNLYDARKKFLDSLHQQRLKQLSLVREEALKQLQSTFDKKLPSKSVNNLPKISN